MKNFVLIVLLFCASSIFAAELPTVMLEKPNIDPNDFHSIMRGAKLFATTCMSCHTLIYLRYNKAAEKAGIHYDKMPVNVKWPAGAVPPDLSLEADYRGISWIYTYLHSFYTDSKRPTGVNNLLVKNTMMPGIIVPLQGHQVLATDLKLSETLMHEWRWYDVLTLQTQGSMTPQEFDRAMTDVVNFLSFASAPFHYKQERLGWGVLGFLLILLILIYLLKREYWKDLKKTDKK